jgi:hypothetical protein
LQIALSHHAPQANQSGALAEVARHSSGKVLLWLLGAVWMLGMAAAAIVAERRFPAHS